MISSMAALSMRIPIVPTAGTTFIGRIMTTVFVENLVSFLDIVGFC